MNLGKELQNLKTEVTAGNAFKLVAGTLISCGAAAAIMAMFKGTIESAKGATKLMMKIGVLVLGWKVGDVTEQYFNETIDDVVKAFKDAKEGAEMHESVANE